MKSKFSLVMLSAGAAVVFANAAMAEGMYGSLMGGASFLGDKKLSGERTDLSINQDAIELDNSYIFGGAIGYEFKEPWRIEGEVTYQNYDVDQIRNNSGVFETGNGDVGLLSFGVNGFYDFKKTGWSVVPYIGAGVGAVYAEANDVQRPGRSKLNESAFAPTGVAMLGLSYDVTPEVTLTTGYRMQLIGVLDGSHTTSSGAKDAEIDSIFIHSITAGLRYNF
jgi:outer membrane autotransporter protein